ncbi:ABC transporter substrate-binding protein [Leifsonia sp. F6_8S_P_1B]|uniref:ABC transporter substrate-binding protein n=1 Tax=Leifsonia williamsii TaxID=3035919 RepID=A0ABT8KB20_9MICO|nr:ABC transporter substrate-binding protein [Leifsonia williamsii]MDN4613544.1 ABC transporter substrate-binding protein [Leifsonia williamsii]
MQNHSLKKRLAALAALTAAALTLAGCSGGAAAESAGSSGSKETKQIVIAEPVHGIGYLPLYAAIDNGYFADEGLEVKVTTLTGGAHVNAVLSNNAWGFIGGAESAAIANAKGASLVAIAGVVSKANVYWVAKKGITIDPDDIAGSIKGLRFAVNRHGGSVEIDSLYQLEQLGLDPQKDMKLINNDVSGSELSLVQSGQADIAATAEPVLGKGITEGVWGEPFVSLPDELGEFAYSDIVTAKATLEKDPATAKAFNAALAKGMDFVMNDKEGAKKVAVKEFPSMTEDVIQATLDRTYADEFWTGVDIPDKALELDLEVARKAGLLQDSANPATPKNLLDLSYLP